MISEKQIEALLEECESNLDRRLDGLRLRLISNRNFISTIWELIALHSTLSLNISVKHEPGKAMPDIQLFDTDCSGQAQPL
jgi:hypothetical protein